MNTSISRQLTRLTFVGCVALVLLVGFQISSVFASTRDSSHELMQSSGIRINVGDDIQSIVSSNPPGTTFILASGVHRVINTIHPKDGDKFIGEPGAILSGAKTLSSFIREGSYWVATGQTQEGFRISSQEWQICQSSAPRCTYPEDLFIDNQPLQHVSSLSQVAPGKWYFDYANDRIYFADDPSGHLVETSVTRFAIDSRDSDLTLQNLIIEKFAGTGQDGAVRASFSNNWVVENNIFRLNHGAGLNIGGNMQIINNQFVYNGQLGLSGKGDNVLVEGNEIAYNNFANFNYDWEAGGTKFVLTDGLVVRNNYVHNNNGKGLWTDIDNINSLIENNLVTYNASVGIYHEISWDAVIRNNISMYNATAGTILLDGAQIQISNSSNVEVYGNITVVPESGGVGISIRRTKRGSGKYGEWLSENDYVHHNDIYYLGVNGRSGQETFYDREDFYANANNAFDYNSYYLIDPNLDVWKWGNTYINWNEIRALGQELNGQLIVGIPTGIATVPTWSIDGLDTVFVENPVEDGVVYRINAGGPSVLADGMIWNADQHFDGGKSNVFSNPIANTQLDALYISERSTDSDTSGFGYQLPVDPGEYTIRLHFAEIWFVGGSGRGTPGIGKRVFNVSIEGEQVISNYDISASVGALTADIKTFEHVTVNDGFINIDFPPASVNRPTLAAIEVISEDFDGAPAVVNLTLVNADTGEDIGIINDGDTFDFAELPSMNLNVRAETDPSEVGSVRFRLNQDTRIENALPYTLWGDQPDGSYNAWNPAVGIYTLGAQPFAEANAGGASGDEYAVTVNFINTPPQNTLAVNIVGEGVVEIAPEQETYESGSEIALVATPAFGWRFAGWSGEYTRSVSRDTQLVSLVGGLAENPLTELITLNNDTVITATFVEIPKYVTSFTLINADTDQDLMTLTNGAVIDLAELPTRNLNVRANTDPSPVGSVRFELNGGARTENTAPYALWGNTGNDYHVWNPTVGSYTLSAEPYTWASLGGNMGTGHTVNFTVIDTPPPTVSGFTLVNADTNQDIMPLTNGMTLDLYTLPTRNLNIRANTSPATVGGVQFSVNGDFRYEDIAPYSLWGDDDVTGYNIWTATVGTYTVVALPYTTTERLGVQRTLQFSVIDTTPIRHTLRVQVIGNGVVNGSSAQAQYNVGTSVQLSAVPAGGWQFNGWSGATFNNSATINVTVNADMLIVANFSQIPAQQTPPPTPPPADNGGGNNPAAPVCDPKVDLSGYLHADQDYRIGTVTNASTTCEYAIGMASYEMFDDIIDNQEIFDYTTATLAAGSTMELSVALPDCAYQSDVFSGDVLMSLNGVRYATRLIEGKQIVTNGNYCSTGAPIPDPVDDNVEPPPGDLVEPFPQVLVEPTATAECAGTWTLVNPNNINLIYVWSNTAYLLEQEVRSVDTIALPGENELLTGAAVGQPETLTLYYDLNDGLGETSQNFISDGLSCETEIAQPVVTEQTPPPVVNTPEPPPPTQAPTQQPPPDEAPPPTEETATPAQVEAPAQVVTPATPEATPTTESMPSTEG